MLGCCTVHCAVIILVLSIIIPLTFCIPCHDHYFMLFAIQDTPSLCVTTTVCNHSLKAAGCICTTIHADGSKLLSWEHLEWKWIAGSHSWHSYLKMYLNSGFIGNILFDTHNDTPHTHTQYLSVFNYSQTRKHSRGCNGKILTPLRPVAVICVIVFPSSILIQFDWANVSCVGVTQKLSWTSILLDPFKGPLSSG